MDASDSIFRPLAQQLSYLFDHKNKFQDLRSKVQDLKDARERVQQSVDSASRKGEVICDDVQRWLAEFPTFLLSKSTMPSDQEALLLMESWWQWKMMLSI
ncbi:hypothetical protein V6N13_103203 [Hibiscus sabdariffa]